MSASGTGPQPRNFAHQPRRPTSRRARQGLRLVNELAALETLPIARAWLAALTAHLPAEVRAAGESLARQHLVMSLDVRAGSIDGLVQRSAPAPHLPTGTMQPSVAPSAGRPAPDCHVAFHLSAHDEHTWQRAVQSLAADTSAAAPILAGELTDDIDTLLARHGAPLVPQPGERITNSCTCDAGSNCAHVAALGILAADRMQAEPSLALVLRGLSATALVERVRQARAAAARQSATAPPAAHDDRAASPLAELSLEEFWRTGPEFDDLAHLPPPNHAPHALLRRLGPSPLGGSFPLVGLLASAYDTIKTHAEKLRDDAELKED